MASPDEDVVEHLERAYGPVRILSAPDAPGWALAGAPLEGLGRLAMGSGAERSDARVRCLGEIAETVAIARGAPTAHVALEAFASQGLRELSPGAPPSAGGGALSSEGVAAGADDADAIRRAALERIERAILRGWWLGEIRPRGLAASSSAAAAFRATCAAARAGAVSRGSEQCLILAGPSPAWVVAAVSRSSTGGEPVLGYAADTDLSRAVLRSAAELFQMEFGLRLAKIARARREAGAHAEVFARIAALEGEKAGLIEAASVLSPADAGPARIDWSFFGPGACATRLAPGEPCFPVWRVSAPCLPTLTGMKGDSEPGPV